MLKMIIWVIEVVVPVTILVLLVTKMNFVWLLWDVALSYAR